MQTGREPAEDSTEEMMMTMTLSRYSKYGLLLQLVLVAAVVMPSFAMGQEADEGANVEALEQQAMQAAADAVAPSVVRIETLGGLDRVEGVSVGTGPRTGLIVRKDGYIITSSFNLAHLPSSILVRMPDGSRKAATKVASDESRRLVLLKVETEEDLPVPEFGKLDDVQVGQWALTLARTYSPETANMTVGIVSGLNRIWGRAIQTDAAVSPVNYGGPLVDIHGRVIGVLTPMSPQSQGAAAGVEWYDSGIGFAAPAEDLLGALPKLIEGTDLHAGLCGIRFSERTIFTDDSKVVSVFPGSPADKAGMKKDDIIRKVDDVDVSLAMQVKTLLGGKYAGDAVHFTVDREGKPVEIDVALVDELVPFAHGFVGILPMRDSASGDSDAEQAGFAVRYVWPDSPAAKADIQRGDVITSVDFQPVSDYAEMRELLASRSPDETVHLQWLRDGATKEADIVLAKKPETLPDADLPPAYADDRQSAGLPEGLETGLIEINIPEFENEVWAYIPKDYDSGKRYSAVIWLHAPSQFDRDATLEKWRPLCDSNDMIMILPKSQNEQWQQTDIELFQKVLDDVAGRYSVDPNRVAAHGHLSGGTVAYLLAFRNRDTIRGVATVDSPIAGRPPENAPGQPLDFFIASSESQAGARIRTSIEPLRKMNFSVTETDIGPASRYLNDTELKQLAQWVDTLDKL